MFIFGILAILFWTAIVAVIAVSTVLAVVVAAGTLVLLRFRPTRLIGIVTPLVAATGGAALVATYYVLALVFEYEPSTEMTVILVVIGFAWSGLGAAVLSGGVKLAVAGVKRLMAGHGPVRWLA